MAQEFDWSVFDGCPAGFLERFEVDIGNGYRIPSLEEVADLLDD